MSPLSVKVAVSFQAKVSRRAAEAPEWAEEEGGGWEQSSDPGGEAGEEDHGGWYLNSLQIISFKLLFLCFHYVNVLRCHFFLYCFSTSSWFHCFQLCFICLTVSWYFLFLDWCWWLYIHSVVTNILSQSKSVHNDLNPFPDANIGVSLGQSYVHVCI